jgi:ABC-type transport system involved in multi-copper enzyme maturation permease subunit
MNIEPRGAVHDLGYKRYVGARRPQSTRLQVIARNVIAMGWRGWWRLKVWLIAAGMAVTGLTVAMYVMLFISKNPIVQGFAGSGVKELRWADFLLPFSLESLGPFGVIVSFTVVAGLVADDIRSGSFEFYFARPLRPIDYTLGKALGAVLAVGAILFVGPILVALARVGMSGSAAEIVDALPLVPQAMLAGAAATLAMAIVPLGFSAISARRTHTLGAWAAYYFLFGTVVTATAAAADEPALAALSIDAASSSIAFAVFQVPQVRSAALPPVWAAALSIGGQVALALAFVYLRVRRAEHAGMGGG